MSAASISAPWRRQDLSVLPLCLTLNTETLFDPNAPNSPAAYHRGFTLRWQPAGIQLFGSWFRRRCNSEM